MKHETPSGASPVDEDLVSKAKPRDSHDAPFHTYYLVVVRTVPRYLLKYLPWRLEGFDT